MRLSDRLSLALMGLIFLWAAAGVIGLLVIATLAVLGVSLSSDWLVPILVWAGLLTAWTAVAVCVARAFEWLQRHRIRFIKWSGPQ